MKLLLIFSCILVAACAKVLDLPEKVFEKVDEVLPVDKKVVGLLRVGRQLGRPGQANANQQSNAASGQFGTSIAQGEANAQGGYGYGYAPYYGQGYYQPYAPAYGGWGPGQSNANQQSNSVSGYGGTSLSSGQANAGPVRGKREALKEDLDELKLKEEKEDEDRDARQYYPGGGQGNANQMSNAMSGDFGTSIATGEANAQGGYGYGPYYSPWDYYGQYGQYGGYGQQPYGYGSPYYGGYGQANANQQSNALSGDFGTSIAQGQANAQGGYGGYPYGK